MTSKEGDGSGSQRMPASPLALSITEATQPMGNSTQASHPDVIDLEAINLRKREGDTEEDANAKKQKKTTSPVWEHFTQYKKSVQVKGEMVTEKWVKCNYCSYEVKHNSRNGTSVFLSHTKSQHSKVAGQQLLKLQKGGSCAASVETYSHLELDTAAAQAPRRRPRLATAAGQGHSGRASAGAQTSPLPPPEPRPRHRRSPRPSRPRRRCRPSPGLATAVARAQASPPPPPEPIQASPPPTTSSA